MSKISKKSVPALQGLNSKRREVPGGAIVFLGVLFWSLNSPLVKFLSLNSLFICALRSAIASVVLIPFIRPKRLKWNGWMLMYVCSYAAVCICVIAALSLTSSPVAIGMQYTASIWLFLLGCVRSRRFSLHGFVPVFIIFVGVLFFMSSGTDASTGTGNLIALSEGIFFAAMTVSSKKAGGTNPVGLTAVANIFTAVVMFAALPSLRGEFAVMTGTDWVVMLVLGAVQVGCGYALYNMGVQRVTPQKASIIALWEMILGPIWVAIFLKEYPTLPVIIGFVIIIAGMLLEAKMTSPPETAPAAARPDGDERLTAAGRVRKRRP